MDWVCSSCGRHFNWSVSECPHCRYQTTVTTSGTQPTSDSIPVTKLPPFNETMLAACPNELPGVIEGNPVLRGARAMYVYLERQLRNR